MRKIFVALLCLFLITSAIAQTSIGFKNPENIQDILDYRLPTWGYFTLYLNFNANGSSSTDKSESMESENSYYRFNFNPYFNKFQESESNITSLSFSLNPNYQFENRESISKTEYSNDNINERKEIYLGYNINASWKHYLGANQFFITDGSFKGSYYDYRNKKENNTIKTDNKYIFRNYSNLVKLGFGIGRIRNVTPVIRAPRFKEKLGTLGKNLNRVSPLAMIYTPYPFNAKILFALESK